MDRFVTPVKEENLKWYHNNPRLIGGIILLGVVVIALVLYFTSVN